MLLGKRNNALLLDTIRELKEENSRLKAALGGQVEPPASVRPPLGAEWERLFLLLEELPAFVLVHNEKDYIEFANRAYRELFGEAVGHPCGGDLHCDQSVCADCPTRRVIRDGAPLQWEWSHPSGRVFQVHDYPILNPEGGVSVVEIGLEITEIAKASRALVESEKRFRIIADYTLDLEFWVKPGGGAEWVNPAVERWTGKSPTECLVDPAFPNSILHPDDAKLVDLMAEQAAKGSPGNDLDLRFLGVDGSIRWGSCSFNPVHDAAGAYLGWRAGVRDITDRKRSEEALSLRKCLLEDLLMLSRMTEASEQESARFVLDAALRATNSALGGVALFEPGQDRPSPTAWSTEAKRRSAGSPNEGHFFRKSRLVEMLDQARGGVLVNDPSLGPTPPPGHMRLKRWCLAPLYRGEEPAALLLLGDKPSDYNAEDLDHAVLLLDGLFTHIGMHRASERLKAARDEAQKADRAKSDFLANMSHEIRTPISGVIGMTDMLISSEDRADRRDLLRMVRDSSRALLNIINDVLDYSKIEADRLEIRSDEFNPRATLEALVASFGFEAENKGLALHLEIDPGLPALVKGDSERLAQVLRNLVDNALKFTDQGGVKVSAECDPESADGLLCRFAVRDTGIGVPKERIDHIFDSFTQLDVSYAKKYQGTGLGLSISKRLVELMGGALSVESVEGFGSRFTFTVRFAHADAVEAAFSHTAEPAPMIRESPPKATRPRILLAEDNLINQMFIEHFLKEAGFETSVAENGLEVLDLLSRERFDCILMDVQMPKMDGVAAVKRIREAEAKRLTPRTPIVALTAFAMAGDKQRFLDEGMDDYIAKPVDTKELLAVVRRLLSDGRTGTEAAPSAPVWAESPPPAAPDADAPDAPDVVDWAALEAAYAGKFDLLREIVALFKENATKADAMLGACETAFVAGGANAALTEDWAGAAHSLVGTAQAVRSKPCADAAKALEAVLRTGRAHEAPALSARLRSLLCAAAKRLERFA